ncbi:Alpha/beta hydrolase fold family protein [Pleurostoma richardsiae]|uniref:Alpha/beta hydrolase fold family protein n=1 Tax=Pleurostoma richardsiae TaxID=41990 RepID=A0AA38VTC2_9PEZI|nr:Alpha/beta hydrolase fold family protein [Pleurostoma richardsiae]
MARQVAEENAIPNTWRTRKPGSIFWAPIGLSILLLRAVAYAIYLVPRSLRPTEHWTYRQALATRLLKAIFGLIAVMGITFPLSLEARELGDRWVVIEPGPPAVYRSPLSSSVVQPGRIGATWYPSRLQKDTSKGEEGLVALCFHSGSFLWMTGRPDDCGSTARRLTSRLGPGARSLWVQYRLAGSDDPAPYPGPFQDALTAYLYLVQELHISPSRIVLAGDSSGATLAIGLVRYLASHAQETGLDPSVMPRACLMFSPSVDYSVEGDSQQIDNHRNQKCDYIDGRMAAWGARAIAPPPIRLDDPYLSPALSPFPTSVPIFAQAGGAEVLCDTIRSFSEAMRAVPGNKVRYMEVPGAPHDIYMVGEILGWSGETEQVFNAAESFVSEVQI